MLNPLLITFHDIDKSEEVEVLIREKFAKVLAENPNVTKCHIVVEKLSKHHQKGNMVCVRMDLKIPHFEDTVISEEGEAAKTVIKSLVILVFKRGIEFARDNKKRRGQKRPALGDLAPVEAVENEESEA
jgi:hypothetical protein